ncbi:MAG TPA: cyclic nucleotide-binding domain-containing protein [Candidatus Sulfotelmatobacter sp.]|nr:cyclic nucleotide-binding domain-containing protein [Candidatus Sulfotelmatobacter sp.]
MIDPLEPIIEKHVFFQGLEKRHIQFIAGCAKNVVFAEGAVVFHEGDPADLFYFVREGLVAIELLVPHRGFTTLQTVGAGDVLGWSWLLPPYRWRFGARTTQPTRALAFDAKCLRAKCEDDHDLGYELYKRFSRVIAERLEATRLQLLDLYGVGA